jgi:hypothetical protein
MMRGSQVLPGSRRLLLAGWMLLVCVGTARGGVLSEPSGDVRVFSVNVEIATKGTLRTQAEQGKTTDLPVESTAAFVFRERRLPPAGRDARALQAVREFETARMQATIQGSETVVELPDSQKLIVASGRSEGVLNYSLRTLLTREQVDLLEMPCDPLTLISLLPGESVDVGSTWKVPEWAGQMLAGVEAVSKVDLNGKVDSLTETEAKLRISGTVSGLKAGAATTLTLEGVLEFDIANNYLRGGTLRVEVAADIGTVAPGIQASVTARFSRRPATTSGAITDALVESIPLDPPDRALELVFDAGPWGLRLRHDRGWYVFHAILDQPPKVVILRLVELGSLVSQCNISPIPDAVPGEHTPLDEFASDIQTSLGHVFRGFKSQKVSPLTDGRTLVEVIATGEVTRTGKDKEGQMYEMKTPMEWRYYIVADASGRQVSCLFALEPALAEQLGNRDRALVESIEFFGGR